MRQEEDYSEIFTEQRKAKSIAISVDMQGEYFK